MAELLTDLKVVASQLEREGHHTLCVIVDGALVPFAQVKTGHVEAAVKRWSDLGGVQVENMVEQALGGLEQRVAALEKQALQAAAPPPPPPPAG